MAKITAKQKIKLPDGRLASGEIYIRPSRDFSYSGIYIPAVTIARSFRDGEFEHDLELQPTPPGVYYEIYWDFADTIMGDRGTRWHVPDVYTLDISELEAQPMARETPTVVVTPVEIKQEVVTTNPYDDIEATARLKIQEAMRGV